MVDVTRYRRALTSMVGWDVGSSVGRVVDGRWVVGRRVVGRWVVGIRDMDGIRLGK